MFGREISRRQTLRGLGVTLSLPWLEAMGPVTGWAAGTKPGQAAPNRMALLYVPNGKNMVDWTPEAEGSDYELKSIMQPLTAHKDNMLVLTGLAADGANSHGDGGGDHARALAAFLTGAHPRKTDGTDIRNGISVDQIAASVAGSHTRLPSLEIGCEGGSMSGNCDSGYSCVYSSTMAWKSATQPLPKEVNPKVVFERMFSSLPNSKREQRDAKRKSILDFVREDSKDLTGKLGVNDVRKLDEYFTALRDIELRIDRAAKLPPVETPDYAAPAGIPPTYEEHIRLMCDLMVLAFQTDSTRVCSFVLANEGSNKSYSFIDVKEGHHELSHHGNNEDKKAKIVKINTFHTTQLAYLLERMSSVEEGDGTLLDHCMLAYGSGNSDGNRHNHDDLPIILAGGGCGTLSTGRHIKYRNGTPLSNLWVSMLDRMEVDMNRVGDSSGALPGLAVG
ncbi:MAG: DUF1552 domain-containing protein [Planctomycetales bacterium]|jgi:hypothetical protein